MKVTFPDLPYAAEALEPHYSAKMVYFHYERHHRAYFDKLVAKIKGTKFESLELEQIIQASAVSPDLTDIFNDAAQLWNHAMFWRSMRPQGGGEPKGALLKVIERDFGAYDKLRKAMHDTAVGKFGSGWTWLVANGDKIEVMATSNADTPLTKGSRVLLALDVWEHAYYLDYQDRRASYVDKFFDHLVNWQHAGEMFEAAKTVATDGGQQARRNRSDRR
jgi:Fe-Mn family superoxide dismutase